MRTVKMKEIFPYAGILSASIYFYYLASKIEFVGRSGAPGPDFWPETILLLTIAACLYEIIKIGFFSKKNVVKNAEGIKTGEKGEAVQDPPKSYTTLLVAGIVLTMAYAYAIELIGFLLSTFLYLVLFMLVGRYRRIGVILASSAIGTLAIAFVFIRLVYISLPQGQGPFSTFSYFILRLMGIK